jgi:two-component system OmpR family sensor kinase
MSIRLRLTLWYTAVLGITVIACSVAIYIFISFVLYSAEKRDMQTLANRIVQLIDVRENRSLFFGTRVVLQLPELNDFRYSGYFVQIVDAEGRVRDRNGNANLPIPPEALVEGGFAADFYLDQRVQGFKLLTYHYPLKVINSAEEEKQYVGMVQIATVVTDIEQTLAALKTILTLVVLIAIVLASSLGWFLAKKALQPIELIMHTTDQIGQADDLNHRIAYDGPQDEIGRLTQTINGMLGRIQFAYQELQDVVKAQRRFVSDASHELRTPLTTIRGNVELMERMWPKLEPSVKVEQAQPILEAIRDISGEAERMSRLVNDLLALARADAGQKLAKEPIELFPIVSEVGRQALHLPRQANWLIGDVSALQGVRVLGDVDAVKQLLFILIENAFKYTPSGEVEMSARIDESAERIGIRIRDTGIGMDKDEVPLIFSRFYRADPSRGETYGTGLGLSIARWIIDELEGSIEVLTKKGEGSTFTMWLPIYYANSAQLFYNEEERSEGTDGSR